jgi:hypothetical protein
MVGSIQNDTANLAGITTVVDEHPRFWCEFILWLISANTHMRNPKRVYFIGDTPGVLVDFAKANNCDIRFSEPLIPGAPHCNKILPYLDPNGFLDQIVTDADVFVTADISKFFHPEKVRLAPNNHGNPPLEIFENLFNLLDLPMRPEPGVALFPGMNGNRETYAGNVSAGVIAIPRSRRDFAVKWKDRAKWLHNNDDQLGRYKVHVDQVSFAIAAAECDLPFAHLPPQTNAILQLLPHIEQLYALHLTSGHITGFPEWFNTDSTLCTGKINGRIADQLEYFNTLVRRAMSEIDKIKPLADFKENFLSPNYDRNKA